MNFIKTPRIYNLFPKICGKITNWHYEIERIKSMHFNWIYINPINEVGFSGSLYSIKDFFKIDAEFAQNMEDQISWVSFIDLVQSIHHHQMKVMVDLVINHTSIDMVETHPEWYMKKWAIVSNDHGLPVKFLENNGDEQQNNKKQPSLYDKTQYPSSQYHLEYRLANPYAIDPSNSNIVTIWGDLAEIDYNSPSKDEILAFWKRLIQFYLKMGVDGFRCDAAYQVAPEIWEEIIEFSRSLNSEIIFWAETLGGPLETYPPLIKAGFDFIACSSKYWDFTKSWCVDQYNQFRNQAKSISFPESHDTPRLVEETNGRKDIQIFRYLFAAFFSAGVMMPIGYEYGFSERLHVVDTSSRKIFPEKFDISPDITQINIFKTMYQGLNEDGLITQYEHPNLNLLFLRKDSKKMSDHEFQSILLVYNKNWEQSQKFPLKTIFDYMPSDNYIFQIYITGEKHLISQVSTEISLKPNEYRFYFQKK